MAKGVITGIIEKDNIPKGQYSGDIDIFISPCGVLGRKNTAILRELYIGKIIYNMKKIVADKLRSGEPEDKVKKLIIDVYNLLDPTKTKDLVKSIQSKLEEKDCISKLKDEKIGFNYIIPPFNIPKFEDIKLAAHLIDIPLDEKVFIPELGCYTKTEVPVGIQYYSAMEQLADDYESTRSTGQYNPVTGQPLKGKSRGGGQSIGNLDIYSLLTYDANNILKEMMTIRSDNMKAKRDVVNQIRMTGSANIPNNIEKGQTLQLFKILMNSIGLDVVNKKSN
jgi:DNA-directed RNA polymerase subunit beta